jgi:hypothetical protein
MTSVVEAQTTQARRTNLTAGQIAQRTLPSVVVLFAKNSATDKVSLGTGFFVDTNIIATNYHVVKNASVISAKLIVQKMTFQVSEIIGIDSKRDLALLRVAGIKIKALTLGNAGTLRIGDEIYVVGNPEGWEGTFSQGIISGFRGSGYIQITAPISHGSSGGPVLNKRGEVIGMAVAAIDEGQNLNFAISSSELAAFQKIAMRERASRASDVPPVRAGRIPTADEYDESLLSKGNGYYQHKLYAKAAEEYEAVIRQNPELAEAYYRLGNSYVRLSRNVDAIAAYKTAVAFGGVHQNIRSDDEAIRAYGELVGSGPGNDLSKFLVGEAYLKRCWNKSAEQKHAVLRVLKSKYAELLHRDIERYRCEYDFSGVDKVPN